MRPHQTHLSQFADAEVTRERRPDGTVLLESTTALQTPARSIGELFQQAADRAPDRIMVAEPRDSGWRTMTYAQARTCVHALAQALLDRRLDRPVLILAGNSIEHLLLALACQVIGLPYVPVSRSYSLATGRHGELQRIARAINPCLVLAEDPHRFQAAIQAVRQVTPIPPEIVTITSPPDHGGPTTFTSLASTIPTAAVADAEARVTPDTVAKYLFTSGSTGAPKGVITTHRMLCANQQMIRQVWPFLADQPPVLLDWLPWSHTFGGSHNTNLVIANAGTLFIDDGRPTPDLIERTVSHLAEIQPTIHLSVPLALRLLTIRLDHDPALAHRFFHRLTVLFYAAAALPEDTWTRLDRLAQRHADHPVALTTAWGTTETAPAALSAHFASPHADCIGVPLPGLTVKLVPQGHKSEIRVKGPTVTPGYLNEPQLTAHAFDDEGYFKSGDAVRPIDPARPSSGLSFDGRLAEDFKLDSGTWVSASTLRAALLHATGDLLTDCLITGHDRPYIAALAWPNESTCRPLTGNGQPLSHLRSHPELRTRLQTALEEAAGNAATSRRIQRLALLDEPPLPDAGEITDKGYINQAACLARRAQSVAELYQAPPDDHLIDIGPASRSKGGLSVTPPHAPIPHGNASTSLISEQAR